MANYSMKDDLALVIRDGSALPDFPELHTEANRAIRMYFTKHEITDEQVTAIEGDEDGLAHLVYAECCKVMALHFQGMGGGEMLDRAAYWNQQFSIAMSEVPIAASASVDLPVFSGGDVGYS